MSNVSTTNKLNCNSNLTPPKAHLSQYHLSRLWVNIYALYFSNPNLYLTVFFYNNIWLWSHPALILRNYTLVYFNDIALKQNLFFKNAKLNSSNNTPSKKDPKYFRKLSRISSFYKFITVNKYKSRSTLTYTSHTPFLTTYRPLLKLNYFKINTPLIRTIQERFIPTQNPDSTFQFLDWKLKTSPNLPFYHKRVTFLKLISNLTKKVKVISRKDKYLSWLKLYTKAQFLAKPQNVFYKHLLPKQSTFLNTNKKLNFYRSGSTSIFLLNRIFNLYTKRMSSLNDSFFNTYFKGSDKKNNLRYSWDFLKPSARSTLAFKNNIFKSKVGSTLKLKNKNSFNYRRLSFFLKRFVFVKNNRKLIHSMFRLNKGINSFKNNTPFKKLSKSNMYKSVQQSFSVNYTNNVRYQVLNPSITNINKSYKISIKSSGKGKTIGRKLIQSFFNKTRDFLFLNQMPNTPQQSDTKLPIFYIRNDKIQKPFQTKSSLSVSNPLSLNTFLNMRVFFQTNKKRMGIFKYHRRLLRRSRVWYRTNTLAIAKFDNIASWKRFKYSKLMRSINTIGTIPTLINSARKDNVITKVNQLRNFKLSNKKLLKHLFIKKSLNLSSIKKLFFMAYKASKFYKTPFTTLSPLHNLEYLNSSTPFNNPNTPANFSLYKSVCQKFTDVLIKPTLTLFTSELLYRNVKLNHLTPLNKVLNTRITLTSPFILSNNFNFKVKSSIKPNFFSENYFLYSRHSRSFISSSTGFLFINCGFLYDSDLTLNTVAISSRSNRRRYSFFYKNDIKRFYLAHINSTSFMAQSGIDKVLDNLDNDSFSWNTNNQHGGIFKTYYNSISSLYQQPKLNNMAEASSLFNDKLKRYGTLFKDPRTVYEEDITDQSLEEPRIKRIKFKPGYQRIWRNARESINYTLNLNFRYQHRLTLRLHKLQRFKNKTSTTAIRDLRLTHIILNSRFVFDLTSSNTMINNALVYVNGIIVTNPNLFIYFGDFIQVAVSIKYYITYRWLTNWNFSQKVRLSKLSSYKNRAKNDLSKQKAFTLPDWIFRIGFYRNDIPKYLEVDYFTLSSFVICEPLSVIDLSPLSFLDDRNTIFNMYNWKYIN